MTEEEQRQQEWVETRFNCTIETTFRELINVIRADLDQFNRLAEKSKRASRFYLDRIKTTHVEVKAGKDGEPNWKSEDCVKLILDNDTIEVYREDDCLFCLSQKWNPDLLDCDLIIDGEVFSIWAISQKALLNLMFGEG